MIEHLTSIVAIDRRGAIGCKNHLPWSIKNDMKFFRRTTTGHTVVMGRKTYDSIGGCLTNRRNLVLSHTFGLFASSDDCKPVNSLEETMAEAVNIGDTETYVIGGAATYSVFAPFVDRYLVTQVDHVAEDADAFLSPELLGEFKGWQAEEVANYPALEGVDQFGFRIMQFDAPDAFERRELRKAMAHQWLGSNAKTKSGPARARSASLKAAQAAFSF